MNTMRHNIQRIVCLYTLILASLTSFNAIADITNPTEDVLIEILGNIKVTNMDDIAIIDRDTINALPQQTINTSSPAIGALKSFKGPLVIDLLNTLKATGDKIIITAWDDYIAEISMSDLKKYPIIMATEANGKRLTIEDQGPIFVVLPFSDFPEISNDAYYGKSVWQVKSIEVE